jgi:hypothetical protein
MMERQFRITPSSRPPKLRLKDGPWPHPDHLTAFHDDIQRLWTEGFQNLLENAVLHQLSQTGEEG